jgi:hypothetical protein
MKISLLFIRHNNKNTGPINTYSIIEEICEFYDSFVIVAVVVVPSCYIYSIIYIFEEKNYEARIAYMITRKT